MALFHNGWITRKAKILYRGATPPNPSKYYLCLADGNGLGRATPAISFFMAELKNERGYARQSVVWAEDGTFSNTNRRHDMPVQTETITASGGSLQFQTAFLIADGNANATKQFAANAIDVNANTITIANHGLSNGEAIAFDLLAGGVLPSPLVASTIYRAINVAANTFQVSTDGTTAIDFTATGTGTFYLRYVAGDIVLLDVDPDPILLQDGKSVTYDVIVAELNATYGAGA